MTDIKRIITGDIKIIGPHLRYCYLHQPPKSRIHMKRFLINEPRPNRVSDQYIIPRANPNWLDNNADTTHVRAGFINLSTQCGQGTVGAPIYGRKPNVTSTRCRYGNKFYLAKSDVRQQWWFGKGRAKLFITVGGLGSRVPRPHPLAFASVCNSIRNH